MKAEIAFMAMRRSNMLLDSIGARRADVRQWLQQYPNLARKDMGYKIKKVLVTVIDDTDDLT